MISHQTVVLGIDGMDFHYVKSNIDELPNIKMLAQKGIVTHFKSVFPPDSIPSWITCYTGKDPSDHGMLESVNYFGGSSQLNVNTSAFKGRTFWDALGDAGYKVCVINPFMAYPVWPVNGVMINGPVFINGLNQTSDPELIDNLEIPKSLGGIVDYPQKKTIGRFIQKAFTDTAEQVDFGLSALKKIQPDFYFQAFLTMDRIQHFLWRYCDPSDPTFPGENPYKNSIKQFYFFMDNVIGRFQEAIVPNGRLIVISDHGHGMRCTKCFNINEFLRKHGYVKSAADGKLLNRQLLIEKSKNFVLEFMHKHDLEDYISTIARFVPNAKKIKKGKHITKSDSNKAYASDFTGTNPFGGVCINRDNVKDYENTRETIIDLLSGVSIRGTPIFKWVRKREDIYKGNLLDRFPDILFCLDSEYGVNWNLHCREITVNPTHKMISGGHREYGVFFSNIPVRDFQTFSEMKMDNFYSTILALFGLDPSEQSIDRSIAKDQSFKS